MRNGVYTIYVLDAAGNQSATTGQITIAGVASVAVSPTQFNAAGGETTTVTASGAPGLNLEAKLCKQNPNTSVWETYRTLSMVEDTAGNYKANWDGKDENGALVPVASYTLQIWHTGSPVRYYPTSTVQVSVGTTSVTASPNPFNPTGTNATTIAVQATPGQTGLSLRFYSSNYPYYWYDSKGKIELPLVETSTPGNYTADWTAIFGTTNYGGPYVMRNGVYTIYVLDAAGNQSATTGQITIAGVASVAVSPSPFTPGSNNFATITASAASGLHLESRIFNNNTNTLTLSIPMSEASGTYTAEWNGLDTYDNFAGANTYRVEIYHAGSNIRYYPTRNIVVNVAVFAISASPDPFVPTGSNSATITVLADARQSDLTTSISHPQSGSTSRLTLREVGSEGTYVAQWDGKINGVIPKDGTCTIRVYDSSGNEFPATGILTLSSAKSLTVSSNPFKVTGNSAVTVTAEMPEGLNLEARIGSVKTLPLTGTGGKYTAQWDGKNDAGEFVASGTHNITLWNKDTGIRYDLQTSLVVEVVDVLPPQTIITSGPAEMSSVGTHPITFSWTGTDNMPGTLTFSYNMDGGSWTGFETATSHTFENIADGQHTFAVKAKDQAGNETPEPALRNFIVDGTSPLPATNFQAKTTSTGIKLEWTHSLSPDIHAYHLYWNNGTGEINYASPYATIYHPSNSFQVSLHSEGTYKFGLRAIDRAGNEESNTSVVTTINLTGFTITVSLEHPTYDRGQDIPISGNVINGTGDPIANAAVTIDIGSKGYHRTYTAYTNQTGAFRYVFQPLANEAGQYTVQARAMHEGLEKNSSSGFEILGMLLQPANVTLDMSMNSSRTVTLKLQNIGATTLSDLQYNLIDNASEDLITGSINNANLPASLNPGASVDIPVTISATAGVAPTIPAIFTISIESTQGSKETAILTAKLHEAVSLPTVTPDPLKAGVRIGEPVTKMVTVTNEGFASMSNTSLTIKDPQTYSWINIINGEFGSLAPAESKTCQILINPPAGMPLGTHVVQLDLLYDGKVKPIYLTVEITTATTGQASFKVIDDTGAVVPGAEVNLISKDFYVNVTPNGRQEYNNVLKGATDAEGRLLFKDVPAGDYRYVISAEKHDTLEGKATIVIGTVPQSIDVMMVFNLVHVDFSVTPTTIQDQYSVSLNITYVTDLIKPTLYANPSKIDLSFFPEETYEGTITIKNTSNNAPVRNVVLNSAALDPIDNEVRVVFANDSQIFSLGELAPQESVQVAFRATIPDAANAKLNSRNLGNIIVTGDYTFSYEGEARESTTTTPIPVLFWRPSDLGLPPISFINDETDGNLNDLEYQGTIYRLPVKSNRDMTFTQDKTLKAVSHVSGGPDSASILEQNTSFWLGNFNRTDPLTFKGDTMTFDIDGLEEALEARFTANREAFLGTSHYGGFFGKWNDRESRDAYLIPISITTIREDKIICFSGGSGGSGGWGGLTIPTFNEHGTVKIQIDQKVSLEREAFDAQLNLNPTVVSLDNVNLSLNIEDTDGNDASDMFFVVVTKESGIGAGGGTLSGPGEISWQIIPSSGAGGDQAEGLNYKVSAKMNYSYSGESYSYTTPAETITVKPMPKLVVDYYLPYIVMKGKPVNLNVVVTNNGSGPAHSLSISSAQPRIVENINNIPVNFTLDGSSATQDGLAYKAGDLVIDFGDVASAGTASGFWKLSSTKDGFFVEIDSTLKHENYLGVELDPLIQEVHTHLVPAIGGRITQGGCSSENLMVEVSQGGELKGKDFVDSSGAYFIQDLTAGAYQWVVKRANGQVLTSREITILPDQPTSTINETVVIDSDNDGMNDCYELQYFGDLSQNPEGDYDSEGLSNFKEYQIGTDPTNPDTDGDGISDFIEIGRGNDPLDPSDGSLQPRQLPLPGPKYKLGSIDPTKPTIVLTHGLQTKAELENLPNGLWTNTGSKGAAGLIYKKVGDSANIIQYIWQDAFQGKGGMSKGDYISAQSSVQDAAVTLTKELLDTLGENYNQPIHFIGHSLGTAVNAYAARAFLNKALNVTTAQFTALDRPHHVDKIPPNIPSLEWVEDQYGYDADFFAVTLPFSREGLTLKVDNYYSLDMGAVGDVANGPIYNHEKLVQPNDVGGKFFEDENVWGIDNNHSGVQQWYRWTIDPNGLDSNSYCSGDTFDPPWGFDDSLKPCNTGWYWSLNGAGSMSFDETHATPIKISTSKETIIFDTLSFKNHGDCTYAEVSIGLQIFTCKESSSPYATLDLNIPPEAKYLSFEFNFENSGDGDYAAVLIDNNPIWIVSGQSATEKQYIDSGPIPISGFTGMRTLTIALYGVGQKNAQFSLKSFEFTYVTTECSPQVEMCDDIDNNCDGIIDEGNVCRNDPAPNKPPIANAGNNITARINSLVTFDGSASQDPDNGPGELTFEWVQDSGPNVILNGPDLARPQFTPDVEGKYVYKLRVYDGLDWSEQPAIVTITVMKPGDLDGDNDVDNADLNIFRASLGACTGAVKFNSLCDYDGNGCVNYADYKIWYAYYRAAQ
jgi:flagellar hook assembly protein FlgD/uncharacterized membrane protein